MTEDLAPKTLAPYMGDTFFQVDTAPVSTSAGVIDLPALYYDASNLTALFRVDRDVAAAKLSEMGLEPGLTLKGDAVAALAFYEYRITSVGDYNEVGLALAAVDTGESLAFGGWLEMYRGTRSRRLGFHILHLPVTTSVADIGGREIWGYPKFVTQIDFELAADVFDGRVADPGDGGAILTFSGGQGAGIPAPPLSLVLFSRLQSRRLRTVVDVRGRVSLHRGTRMRLEIGDSAHPMATDLADLGLGGAAPMLVMATERFQSRLHAGRDLP